MQFQRFVENPGLIVQTVGRLCEAKGESEILRILKAAAVRLENTGYDNWNGGTYYYTLFLDVPMNLFATFDDRITDMESAILKVIGKCFREDENNSITTVLIQPQHETLADWPREGVPLTSMPVDKRVDAIWTKGFLRLFLSHVSKHKVEVSELKKHLAPYGVTAFVAHEDIEPDQEWLEEISIALSTADALTALLTDGFHESNWTDQEVGIAFGRKMPVLTVRLGVDPYGFMNKKQAITGGNLSKPAELASKIVAILLRNQYTQTPMREGLVNGLASATRYDDAKTTGKLIMAQAGFTIAQYERILKAANENSQVDKADYGSLGSQLRQFVYQRAPQLEPVATSVASLDEYDPFAD